MAEEEPIEPTVPAEPEEPAEPEAEQAKQGGGAVRAVLELVVIVAVAMVLAFGFTHLIAQPYQIPSGSMEDTIEVGDYVLSEKVTLGAGVQKGDIVTFADPEQADRTLIKRVIATGGQTVDLRDGVVYVDGTALEESSYTLGKPSYELSGSSITFPYTVPEGYIWVMGDNRTNSQDSRWFGAVPESSVSGVAVFRYWPLNRIGTLD